MPPSSKKPSKPVSKPVSRTNTGKSGRIILSLDKIIIGEAQYKQIIGEFTPAGKILIAVPCELLTGNEKNALINLENLTLALTPLRQAVFDAASEEEGETAEEEDLLAEEEEETPKKKKKAAEEEDLFEEESDEDEEEEAPKKKSSADKKKKASSEEEDFEGLEELLEE